MSTAASEDEAELIERARQRDVQAFTELLFRHQGRVRAFIGGAIRAADVVDDLAQDAFVDAFKTLHTYEGRSSFGTWLLGIARNKVLMFLRSEVRRRRRERTSDGWLVGAVVQQLESDDQQVLSRRERELLALKQCMKSLPPASAHVIAERYLKTRSISEIARESGRREGTVRMTLLRIRQALRTCVRQRLVREGG